MDLDREASRLLARIEQINKSIARLSQEEWQDRVRYSPIGAAYGTVVGIVLDSVVALVKSMIGTAGILNPITAVVLLLVTAIGGFILGPRRKRRLAAAEDVSAHLKVLRAERDQLTAEHDRIVDLARKHRAMEPGDVPKASLPPVVPGPTASAVPDTARPASSTSSAVEPVHPVSTQTDAVSPLSAATQDFQMTPPIFSWVHLSDIHFGHGDAEYGWDQQLVLEALLDDLRGLPELRVPAPRAVLITGDIAFSGGGRATEYAEAAAWLGEVAATLNIPLTSIYLVPGNHDVDRKTDNDPNVRRHVEALRERHVRGQTLDDSLKNPAERAQLTARQKNYLDFASGFAPQCSELHWTATLLCTPPVRIVGLNTALLAKDNSDHGLLRVGKEQLARSLGGASDDTLVLVLAHHPTTGGWLADAADVDRWVRRHAHVLLTGHVHDPETQSARSGAGRDFVSVAAGAVHGDAEEVNGHGYSVGAVYLIGDGEVEIRIWPRLWADKNKQFRIDIDNVPGPQEYASHRLRLRRIV